MPQNTRLLNFRGYLFALLGCVIGIVLFIALRTVYPIEPSRCADGWGSKSIGVQGACSHHGGVVGGDTMPKLLKLGCPAIGLLVFWFLANAYGGFAIKTKSESKYGTVYTAEIADLIDRAIFQGRSIKFSYKKRHETYVTKRTIKPSHIKYLRHDRPLTMCVVGHCHDREAERTFLLTRMSDVEVF